MIQRIQSLYLALVFVLVAVMSFLPLVVFKSGELVFYMNIFRFEGVEHLPFAMDLPNIWPIALLAALLAITSIASIFRYRKRNQQLLINMFGLLINFGLLISVFLYADAVGKFPEVDDQVIYDVAAYFPIATVLLFILANRNIRKDEKLVKESDRLR